MKTQKLVTAFLLVVLIAVLASCGGAEDNKEEKETPAKQPEKGTTTVVTTPETPVEPIDTMPALGIDVSEYQDDVDWGAVKADGKVFGYAKATLGITYTDPKFKTNWENMKAAGVIRGAYHFYEAQDDPTKQAENFLNAVGTLEAGDLPPVVDLEGGGDKDGTSNEGLNKNVLVWLQLVEEKLGMKPIIYTNYPFSDEHLTDPRFAEYDLWLAEYTEEAPRLPKLWEGKQWTMWQYISKGTVNGIKGNVDHDKFNGNLEQLKAITKQ